MTITLMPHDAPILPPVELRCPSCGGFGRWGSDIFCDRCNGTGQVQQRTCYLCKMVIADHHPTATMLVDHDAGDCEVGPQPDIEEVLIHADCKIDPRHNYGHAGWLGLWTSRDLRANDTGCITTEALPDISKGWLARLTPKRPGDAFDCGRDFARRSSQSRSHSGGALIEYELRDLQDGIYECETVSQLATKRRVYLLIADHRVALVYKGKPDALIALNRDWTTR